MSLILTNEDRIRGMAHGVPDDWLTSRLVPWMFVESGGTAWWVCVLPRTGIFLSGHMTWCTSLSCRSVALPGASPSP